MLLIFANTATAPNQNKGKVRIQLPGGMSIKTVKVWNGSAWVQKPVRVWNGTTWKFTFNTDTLPLYEDSSDIGFFYGRALLPDTTDQDGFYTIYDNAVAPNPADVGFYTTGGS